MMRLTLDNGYLDMGAVLSAPYPFTMIIGARGTGKTYGALKCCMEQGRRFLYFRRTSRILDIISDPAYNPFKVINRDTGRDIVPEAGKGITKFIDREAGGELIGYASALSTFANLRGFDGSDITTLIYDEFIPEPQERVTFNAYTALLNAIETVGRNREFTGGDPLKVLLMSNSDLIYSDIIAGFRAGQALFEMQETGEEVRELSKDFLLIRPKSEAFKEQKEQTALYRITAGSDYAAVALENKFPIEDRQRLGKRSLKEFKAVAAVKGLCIYRHKSAAIYYVSSKISGAPKEYDNTVADVKRFVRENINVWRAAEKRKVYYESIDVQIKFKEVFT